MSIETARLILREMSRGDLPFVAKMLGDPEVMRFYPNVLSPPEAEAWIDRQVSRYERDGYGLWLALEKDGARAVGQIGLLRQSVNGLDEDEVGYLLHRASWGPGYATEAATAVRDHAFQVLHRKRVISLIRPENLPSQRVARRLGMRVVDRTLFAGLSHLVFAAASPFAPPPDGSV